MRLSIKTNLLSKVTYYLKAICHDPPMFKKGQPVQLIVFIWGEVETPPDIFTIKPSGPKSSTADV